MSLSGMLRRIDYKMYRDLPVFKVTRSEDGVHLFFFCPWCKKEHFHGAAGAPDGEEHISSRSAHCYPLPEHRAGIDKYALESPFLNGEYVLYWDGKTYANHRGNV